jgi:hypothetical protein
LADELLAPKRKTKTIFATPDAVTLQLHLSNRPYEVFAVLFVDAHNRMLALLRAIADVEFGNAYVSDAARADNRDRPVTGSPMRCRPEVIDDFRVCRDC